MNSSEIVDRLQKYPLSKNEIVEYLVNLQASKDVIERDTYKKLMTCPRFKELLDEMHVQRIKKRECKRIMD